MVCLIRRVTTHVLGTLLKSLIDPSTDSGDQVLSVATLNGDVVFTGTQSGSVRRWDLRDESVTTLTSHVGAVNALETSSGRLMSGGEDSKIVVWDVLSPSPRELLVIVVTNPVTCLLILPGASQLVACVAQSHVGSYSLDSGASVLNYTVRPDDVFGAALYHGLAAPRSF
jgi:WD40 repeat protein